MTEDELIAKVELLEAEVNALKNLFKSIDEVVKEIEDIFDKHINEIVGVSKLKKENAELKIRLDEAHRCLSAKNTVYTYPATVQYIEQEEMGENVIKGEGNEVDRDK